MRKSFASPPTRPVTIYNTHQGQLSSLMATKLAAPKRARSTMLTGEIHKPWLEKKDPLSRIAYLLTYAVALIGIGASVVRVWFAAKSVNMLTGNLCLILDDDFNGDSLNTDIWDYEVTMGGFGNDEFEMTTDSSNNTFLRDGYLYILPTLTSDVIGRDAIMNGYTYNITGCTTATYNDTSSCGAVSNITAAAVINPVMSARINTKKSRSIRYGRVEIRAKNPIGDWLWPALWMLPVNDTYGPWPLSGEIDIMESRGNGLSYAEQGSNYVRGSLNWGPLTWINEVWRTTGWWTERRSSFADDFHTYAVEWDDKFIRAYVDTRLHAMLEVNFNVPFFERGDFPPVVTNGSEQIVLENPWVYGSKSAPFDMPFYLIMDVAVGGTNGWFADNVGDKPWINGATNAMQQFAEAQDKWAATWPEDDFSRALVVDYVKMWQQC
ncbi:glycoside hydrolase family 16 protein [Neolentinus lepideus HHB14362 ss-1]|uniref:Glycoside hydrolase family 16 protein n=1 Tax=Neolentinus lepideus HHB14362 ss-1 TaxID=1314782 RepID=A0A165VUX8_9AGAM|nr:glycoside hydrolase family 16 protein [Neolentinus lepideus HHB14362 ss-1]